jgi:hypothetical protein
MKKAIDVINKKGILLVFPINNRKEPDSLWSQFYPRSKMDWSWDEDGDDRVAKMWSLMKRLSDCREVVVSRACYFFFKKTFYGFALLA